MDDETPQTQIEQLHRPILTLSDKPRVVQRAQNPTHLYYGLANNHICLVDVEKAKILNEVQNVHSHKIGCMRYKENLLMTGGYDHTVKLYDPRTFDIVHTFQKIPGKFNSVDRTHHILAAANNANIIFWDLRKMKQRSEFNESFNGEITYIRFQDNVETNLLGCSIDGMMNMFDLTKPNEQQAFSWCFKTMQSPQNFTLTRDGVVLVETIDHVLYKVKDGDHYGKIQPNNPQNPRHIIYSSLLPQQNCLAYEYSTWSPEQGIIELWRGDFFDRSNREQCFGYINGVPDLQIFTMLENNRTIFADEKGNIFSDTFGEERKVMRAQESIKTEQQMTKPWKFSKGLQKISKVKQAQGPKSNKNGYIIDKPPSAFSKDRKYKPF